MRRDVVCGPNARWIEIDCDDYERLPRGSSVLIDPDAPQENRKIWVVRVGGVTDIVEIRDTINGRALVPMGVGKMTLLADLHEVEWIGGAVYKGERM
jgi:hypothetical protein